MKNNNDLKIPFEELYEQITKVIKYKTIDSEPDIYRVYSGDEYFETSGVLDYSVFREKWLKTFHVVLPIIAESQLATLWNKVLAEKTEFVQAKEVSEPVLIAHLFIEYIKDLPVTANHAKAFDIFFGQDELKYLRLSGVRKWLIQNQFEIRLSTFSKVLVELGVKVEGIKVIPYSHMGDNDKLICWGFVPYALKNWGI
jgi:hypothetical protein